MLIYAAGGRGAGGYVISVALAGVVVAVSDRARQRLARWWQLVEGADRETEERGLENARDGVRVLAGWDQVADLERRSDDDKEDVCNASVACWRAVATDHSGR